MMYSTCRNELITGFSMLTGAIIAFALGMIVESVSSNNANAQAEGGAE